MQSVHIIYCPSQDIIYLFLLKSVHGTRFLNTYVGHFFLDNDLIPIYEELICPSTLGYMPNDGCLSKWLDMTYNYEKPLIPSF